MQGGMKENKKRKKESDMGHFNSTSNNNNDALVCQMQHELDVAREDLIELKKEYHKLKSKLGMVDLANDEDFEAWWILYDKKRGKKQTKAYWLKNIKSEDLDDIVKNTILYVLNTDKNFRKDAIRYLRNECWNDEVIERVKTKEEIDKEVSEKEDKKALELSKKSIPTKNDNYASTDEIRDILLGKK